MNPFDHSILAFLNSFAHRSTTFDVLVGYLANSELPKGDIVMGVFCWAWFRSRGPGSKDRTALAVTLVGAIVAIIVGRSLSLLLPFRMRPFENSAFDFIIPYGPQPGLLRGWSSFPSDHAMLFFELAIGMLYVSRAAGLLLLAHAVLVVSLPRIYLGLHYPTDILGGALIGALTALAMNRTRLREWAARPLLRFHETRRALFYGAMFIVASQIASMFWDLRALTQILMKAVRH
jgi:undecaprenyl-diphosphatase